MGIQLPNGQGHSSPLPTFRPTLRTVALWYGIVVLSVCLSVCLSVTLVYCAQTVGWIKMPPLGTEIDLGPGDIVLDGDPVPPSQGKGHAQQPPTFRPTLLWHGHPSH